MIYNKFAYIYDDLMNDFNYRAWSDYIEEIFKRYGVNVKNILEMACGTGNLTIEMAKKGYNITAFDMSAEMLSMADEKLKIYNNVKLLNLDMVEFNTYSKYDSVVAICDSINYILDKKELYKVFTNAYNHLEDGGIFIFDINSSYKLKEIIGDNTFIEDRDDVYYTWSNYLDKTDSIVDFFLTFFVKDQKTGQYIRFDEDHSEKIYEVEDIVGLLKRANFKKVEYMEAFTFSKVKSDSERINFIAIK